MEASHPFYFVADALKRACADPLGEVDVAVLVARIVDPASNATQGADQLAEIQAAFPSAERSEEKERKVTADTILCQLIDVGFGRKSSFQATEQHSNLFWAWDQKQGLPIVLALLIMAVARRAGLTARGVNFPGHFLVEVDGELIDPLTMAPMQKSDDLKIAGLYANAESIGLRMLNNLKSLAIRRSDLSRVLDLLDLQLHICSSDEARATLFYEQAEVWLKFGSVAPAATALANCIVHAQQKELRAQAEKKLVQLRGRKETQH